MVVIRSDGAGSKDELRQPFVEQRTYRRRRLMDVARLAPIFGALLFLVPLIWPVADGGSGYGASVDSANVASANATSADAQVGRRQVSAGIKTSSALVYLVSVWLGLILFSLCFSAAVRRWAVHWTGQEAAGAEAPTGVVSDTSRGDADDGGAVGAAQEP